MADRQVKLRQDSSPRKRTATEVPLVHPVPTAKKLRRPDACGSTLSDLVANAKTARARHTSFAVPTTKYVPAMPVTITTGRKRPPEKAIKASTMQASLPVKRKEPPELDTAATKPPPSKMKREDKLQALAHYNQTYRGLASAKSEPMRGKQQRFLGLSSLYLSLHKVATTPVSDQPK